MGVAARDGCRESHRRAGLLNASWEFSLVRAGDLFAQRRTWKMRARRVQHEEFLGPLTLGRVSYRLEPDCDGTKDYSAAVSQCEFVIAGRDASPLFESFETSLDHVGAFVRFLVETWRPSALHAESFSVGDMVRAFRYHGLDTAIA